MSGSKPIDVNITGERHLFGLLGVTCTFTATFTDDHSPVCPPITITTLTVGQAKRAILPVLVGTAIQRRANMGTPIDMSGIPMGEDTAAWAVERARRWWHTHDWDDDARKEAK